MSRSCDCGHNLCLGIPAGEHDYNNRSMHVDWARASARSHRRSEPIRTVPRCRIWSKLIMQPSASAKRRAHGVGCEYHRDIRVLSGTTYHLPKQGVADWLLAEMMIYPRGYRNVAGLCS